MIKGQSHLILATSSFATILVLPVTHAFSRGGSDIAVFTELRLGGKKDSGEEALPGTESLTCRASVGIPQRHAPTLLQ
jgi:hypothetical protein